MTHSHYRRLILMTALSFASMYALMYAMVDMIPHHAGAILMCGKAPVQEPAIRDLCESIIASQQAEIDQMKLMLGQLER